VEAARQVATLTDQAHTASARATEIEKRACEGGAQSRAGLGAAGGGGARGGAQGQVQLEQAERLKRVEAEMIQARAATAAAREEAAQLRGQAEALTNQHAELMRVIQDRDGERSPKGGKK